MHYVYQKVLRIQRVVSFSVNVMLHCCILDLTTQRQALLQTDHFPQRNKLYNLFNSKLDNAVKISHIVVSFSLQMTTCNG